MIINYINNSLSIEDIKKFSKENNYNITNQESIIIYNFIKENYEDILNNNESKLLELKNLIREDLYNEIIKIYKIYKSKYF